MNAYNYQSAAEKIRNKYTERESSELESLRRLDSEARRPVNIFSYVFGVIAAIIMGSGMSLVLTDISSSLGLSGDPMIPGVVIGVVGMLLAIVNYPLHRRILEKRKKEICTGNNRSER